MITWARLLTVIALTATGTACAKNNPPSAALPTLRFAFVPAVDSLSFLVMVDQRFDRDHGFALAEVEVVGGRAALDALAGGRADIGQPGSVQFFADARAGLVPGKVVAIADNTRADPDHPAAAAVVGRDIDSWRDLDGATIAVNQIGSLGHAAGKLRLEQEGVVGFTFAEIGLPNQGLAVADGSMAAAIMFEPYRTQSIRRGDGRVLDWVIGGEPFPEFPLSLVAARGDLTRDRPDLVRAFLAAHLDAVEWIARNERAARDLLAQRLDLEPAVAEAVDLNPYVADGRFDRSLLERAQRTIAAADPTASPVPADDLVDERLLLEVLDARKG